MRIILIVALLCGTANADRWTKTDTALQAAVGATLLVDYIQTRQLMRDGWESNFFMRTYETDDPPMLTAEVYFLAVAALHTYIATKLPKPYRNALQGITIGLQVETIGDNYRLGYGLAF